MKKILNIVLCLLICFIFTGCSSNNKEESSVYSSSNQEVIDQSEEVEEETKPTIEEIADEEATWFKSAKFNSETNILTCKLEFRSNVGIDNGILMANTDAYKIAKGVEKVYPNKVSEYKFKYYHDTEDKYGNLKNECVYSIKLDGSEVQKVNFDNIEPSDFVKLGEVNKSLLLYK